jgi:hypothetical protein
MIGARPVHFIGHNTNSIAEVRDGLARGLNAFEPDINVDQFGQLFVSHGSVQSPTSSAPPLVDFLRELRVLFASPVGQAASLLLLDCKIDDPAKAVEIRDAVRRELTAHVDIPVVYSVPTLAAARRFFPAIAATLRPDEAVMVDEEDDAGDVFGAFQELGVTRGCYGNGISTVPLLGIGLPSPNLAAQLDAAVALRARGGLAWTYSWVLVREATIVEHLRIGVDAVMIDASDAAVIPAVLAHPDLRGAVRLATRADNPFRTVRWPVLAVATSDVRGAGTDATLEFVLRAAAGATWRRAVDGSYAGRFERRSENLVTWPGVDAATIDVREVVVSNNGSHLAPDWHLAAITLHLAGQPRVKQVANWITAGNSLTIQL